MKKIIVAIDGYAGTGKSTQAKCLAKHFGCVYVDSGAMYRAVTYFGQQQTTDGIIDIKLLIDSLPQISIDFELNKNEVKTPPPAPKKIKLSSYVSSVKNSAPVSSRTRSMTNRRRRKRGLDLFS